MTGLEEEVGETPSITNDLRRQLEAAQSELAAARKRYAPDHPDRVRLEAAVKSLETQLSASAASAPVDIDPASSGSSAPAADAGGYRSAEANGRR